jgi:hypothetical protein
LKYFTDELLERVRSLDDEVSGQAHDEWERAITSYQRRLREIGAQLPASVRRFRRQFCLHDAQVITMAEQDKQFFIVLQLEPPSTTTIFLKFG